MVDFQEKLTRIQQALANIAEKAEEDGIITDEEMTILETAKTRVKEYEQMISEALEDGIIDEEEKSKLIDLEEKLYSDTYFAAMEDTKIDDDELLLLKTLIKSIDPKASISWLSDDQ